MWSRWLNNGFIEGGGGGGFLPMDRCILKIFLPRFRIQCEIVMDFAVVAIALDYGFIHFYFFGPGFWSLYVIKYFCQDFGLKSKILMEHLVNKSSQIGGFAYPYSPLSSLHCYRLREKC